MATDGHKSVLSPVSWPLPDRSNTLKPVFERSHSSNTQWVSGGGPVRFGRVRSMVARLRGSLAVPCDRAASDEYLNPPMFRTPSPRARVRFEKGQALLCPGNGGDIFGRSATEGRSTLCPEILAMVRLVVEVMAPLCSDSLADPSGRYQLS